MRALYLLGLGIAGVLLFRRKTRFSGIQRIASKRGDSPLTSRSYKAFKLSSPAFAPGQPIPAYYSGEADDKSPPFRIEGTPSGTRSLALIMDDPDSPFPPVFDHWLVWNIPPDTTDILEGRVPPGAVQGKNSLKNTHYNGPCTPNGTHRYYFKLFALDTVLDLPPGSRKRHLLEAMRGHILAQSNLIGLYTANRTTQGNLAIAMLKAATKA